MSENGTGTASGDGPQGDGQRPANTVSVVIPTYYRNGPLRDCIESVLRQDYSPIEIIVVDDSGEEYAQPVVSDYDVTYVGLDENIGAQGARNRGIEEASGVYLQLLDDDDTLHHEKIAKQVALLNEGGTGVVYCGVEWETGHTVLPDPDIRGDVLEHALMFEMAPCVTSTMLIEMGIVAELVPLPESFGGADDVQLKIELARRTEFDFVDEALVTRTHSTGDSLGSAKSSYTGRYRLLEAYGDLYADCPPAVRKTALSNTYLRESEYELDNNLWSLSAITAAVKAVYNTPSPFYIGYLLASVFGRPGRNLGKRVYLNYKHGK